jgi:hypothetical protein
VYSTGPVLRLVVHHLTEHDDAFSEDNEDDCLKEDSGGKAKPHGRAIHHGEAFLGMQLEKPLWMQQS